MDFTLYKFMIPETLTKKRRKKFRVSHIILKENDVLDSEDIIGKIKEIKDSNIETISLPLKMLQKNILRMHLQSKVVI